MATEDEDDNEAVMRLIIKRKMPKRAPCMSQELIVLIRVGYLTE